MGTSQESIQQEILAAFCLIGDEEKGKRLFSFASADEQSQLERIADRLLKEGEVDRKQLIGRLQKLSRVKSLSSLEETHPGWILEKLQGESPRLFGLLCRHLSGEKVRYLIQHLSPSEKGRLPKVSESYQVSPEISELVRKLIEARLTVSLPPLQSGAFSFAHISVMKADDLLTLFRDLGLDEIRKGFSGVDPNILRAFLSRFSIKDATEIRGRIEHGSKVSKEASREAQRNIVSLPLEQLPSEELIREIGYSVFARALSPEEISWSEIVWQKFSPGEGHRLKRIVKESVVPRPPDVLKERQSAVLSRVTLLANKGLIRRYWKVEDKRWS